MESGILRDISSGTREMSAGTRGAVGAARGLSGDRGGHAGAVETREWQAGFLAGDLKSDWALWVGLATRTNAVDAIMVIECPAGLVLGAQAQQSNAQLRGVLEVLFVEVVELGGSPAG